MTAIRIYLDEDVSAAVARALPRRGMVASTTLDHGKQEFDDPEQLRFAASIGAALLTHNVSDFPRLHTEFLSRGESNAGIIVAKQVSIGEIVRRLLRLAARLSAEDMENRLEYLSNW